MNGKNTMSPKTMGRVFVVFTAALVMLVSATFIQSYQGRVDAHKAQIVECQEAVKLREELIEFQKITLEIAVADSASARRLRENIETLESRSVDCADIFPKPTLIGGFGP